jgi:hypothetical protein
MGSRSKSLILSAILAGSFTAASPAYALTTFFNDWDSTDFGAGPGFTVVASYEGWTAVAGSGIEIQYNAVAGAPLSGENLVELDSFNNTMMQRAIDAGDYTLSFYYSPRPGVGAGSNGIEVLVDGSSIFTITGPGAGNTVWTQYSLDFSLAAAGTLAFRAIGTSDGVGGYLENVSLGAAPAVPEGSTWTMMLAGLGAAGAVMRRRKLAVQFA